MNICSKYHDEVVYEGSICPCCDIIKDLEAQVKDANRHITELEHEIEDLNNIISKFEEDKADVG